MVRTVRRYGDAYVLVKDCEKEGGTARYLVLYNGADTARRMAVDFFAIDLAGKVAFFDLVERADLGLFEQKAEFEIPAHGARFFRLDAERRR